jgi:hypothetical protein
MTGLILPYILGIYVISFSISISLLFFCFIVFNIKKKIEKKIGREDVEFYLFFSFDSFSNIVCVFV